jgi:pyroglutamyl-peptidase
MAEILATGYGPFGRHRQNASWEALVQATPALPTGVAIKRVLLDVQWAVAARQLLDSIGDETRWVIAFGVADDPEIRIERFAVNAADGDTPDAAGERYGADSLRMDGPAAYETALPRSELVARLRAAGLPARESHHAGSYLCNFAFYHLMDHITRRSAGLVAGFVHVPPPDQMALSETARAIATVIETVVRQPTLDAR